MIGRGLKRRSHSVLGLACRDNGERSPLRRYLGAFVIAALASIVVFVCLKFALTCILMLLNIIDAAIENFNRSIHTLVIRRFDDELHVKTQIDPKLQISHVFLAPPHQPTCLPRDTIKDFDKGTEVFSEGENCFVRFYNQSEESYAKQMLLFETLQDLPLEQSAEPAVFQAVQHLQFTDGLYELLGRQVAVQCDLRRLLWILPAGPQLARHLTTCRCFDTAHARLSVCLQTDSDPVKAPQFWENTRSTEGTLTERPRRPPPVVTPPRVRRAIDSIVMRPDGMEVV